MRGTFFDLREKELAVYTFGKNGEKGGYDSVTVPVGEGYSFSMEESAGKTGESCLSLPLSLLDFRVLELPFSDFGKIRELLPFEIDGLVLGGSGSVAFDAYFLEKIDGKSRVLVAYVAKDILRSILRSLKAAGFDPRAVTSLELAGVLASSAPEEEMMNQLLSPQPLSEDQRAASALREMSSPTINLRTGEFAYTVETERTRRSLRLSALLAALVLSVLLADVGIRMFLLHKENRVIRDDIRKSYLSVFPDEKKITNELYQLKAHYRELRERKDSFTGVSPLEVLMDLSKVVKSGTVISEVTVDKDLIVVKGECPSLSDAQSVKSDMEAFFADVTITDTKPSSENRTRFTITAKGRK